MFTHFYSDPHFFHKKIIEYATRPFRTVEEMNFELIKRYNETVGDDDHVLWCGDVSFGNAQDTAWAMGQLKGERTLVLGNHDRGSEFYLKVGFKNVFAKETKFFADGLAFRASHYPSEIRADRNDRYPNRRPDLDDGEFLVHGHSHSVTKRVGRNIHVGVDAWGYRPATLAEVVAQAREYLARHPVEVAL